MGRVAGCLECSLSIEGIERIRCIHKQCSFTAGVIEHGPHRMDGSIDPSDLSSA